MQDSKEIIVTAWRGMLAIVVNQFFLRFLSIISGIILARWLSPEVFGINAICFFLMGMIGCLSDIGFALGLVRSTKDPSQRELQAYFSFQFLVVGAFSSVLVIFASPVGEFFGIPIDDIWALKAFIFFALLNIFWAPSQILLQRKLAFGVLAKIQTISIATGQVVAIISAISGFGIGSFVMASAFTTMLRITQIRLAEPFPIRLHFNFKLLKPYFAFGLAGQGTEIILSIQKHIGSALVGSFQGAGAAGYFSWAWSYITLPNDFFRSLNRANFSSFSRLQNNKEELAGFSKQILRSYFLLGLPCSILLVFWVIPIIENVYSSKWLPSIAAVYPLVVYSTFMFLIDPLIALLLSLGHSRKIVVLTSSWFFATLLISTPLVLFKGISGMGIGYSLGAIFMSALLIFNFAQLFNVNLFRPVVAPLLAGISMALFLVGINQVFPQVWFWKIFISLLSCGVFLGVLFLIDRSEIKKDFNRGFSLLKNFGKTCS